MVVSSGGWLVLGMVVCSGDGCLFWGGHLFWRRLSVLATVVCLGDGRLSWRRSSVLATVVCPSDGRLSWGRSSVLATVVRSGDGCLFWGRLSILVTAVCSGGLSILAAVLYWLLFWCLLRQGGCNGKKNKVAIKGAAWQRHVQAIGNIAGT